MTERNKELAKRLRKEPLPSKATARLLRGQLRRGFGRRGWPIQKPPTGLRGAVKGGTPAERWSRRRSRFLARVDRQAAKAKAAASKP